jgi:triphosphoribosyl-dephospho-CoA synthase
MHTLNARHELQECNPLERAPPMARTPAALAAHAVDALMQEALLTPKPGLVDRRGNGAHRDLDLGALLRSARALGPSFKHMAEVATNRRPDQALREQLARIGRAAEFPMFAATGGSNSHRGALWAIGLLIAARASLTSHASAAQIAAIAGRVAQHTDRFSPSRATHGANIALLFGVDGARGEAERGFPHVIGLGLPTLLAGRRRGIAETWARLDALLAIMSSLPDTCVIHRGGMNALESTQRGAAEILVAGGTGTKAGRQQFVSFEQSLLVQNVSPGGAADLLAACLFLDAVADQPEAES